MRHAAATLALCCLLLLAGCGGTTTPAPGGDTAAPATTSTPTDTSTTGGGDTPAETDGRTVTPTRTPAPSPTTSGRAFPPGTDASGVTDVDSLVAAHRETLATASYHTLAETRVEVGDGVRVTTQRVRSNPTTERARTRAVAGDLTIETFRNATRFYRNESVDGNRSYVARDAGTSFADYHRSQTASIGSVRSLFTLGNYSVAGNTTVGGEAAVVFELDEINRSAINESTTVESATGTLVVTRAGLVHRGNLSVRAERDGVQRVVELSFRVVERGDVSVEAPGWLSEAEAGAEN